MVILYTCTTKDIFQSDNFLIVSNKKYTNKICRDNNTALHLLFLITMHLLMSTCNFYKKIDAIKLMTGSAPLQVVMVMMR